MEASWKSWQFNLQRARRAALQRRKAKKKNRKTSANNILAML